MAKSVSNKDIRSAGGVVIDDDGRVLFCHPTGSRWSNWRMPKGVVDDEEDPRTAALREVLEETGYKCTLRKKLTTTPRYRSSHGGKSVWKVLWLYLMRPVKQVQKPDWENDKFVWVPFPDLEKYMATAEREAILEAVEKWKELDTSKHK